MPYVAGRRIKIGDSFRQIGEPVPEAEGFKRFRALLAQGYLRFVETEKPDETQRGVLVETPESFQLEKPAHTGTVKLSQDEPSEAQPEAEPTEAASTPPPNKSLSAPSQASRRKIVLAD